MDRYEEILESIKNSKKEIKTLPVSIEVLNCVKKRYEINEESLFGTIIFKTGGIIVENWLRFYGSGELNFYQRNDLFPYSFAGKVAIYFCPFSASQISLAVSEKITAISSGGDFSCCNFSSSLRA